MLYNSSPSFFFLQKRESVLRTIHTYCTYNHFIGFASWISYQRLRTTTPITLLFFLPSLVGEFLLNFFYTQCRCMKQPPKQFNQGIKQSILDWI
ncbi:uncharacterized protein BO97DRAFT_79759 [Aspergillus homomorphus CBS 101889]|uniref:Uncharacterized protein n=1 Tax=Aspergillus homomorphus (strain CBS 101889) TaxID=1450537 RepID=A0A395IAF6_ASPHC|nr:hypothetical protein BO97DRAFT_79759 [Aspergillus homomorphus CBS 101889]RAL16945.1 hypothetical protein BO97DRAFT_79759 [Aspergillus homomorphus CBS 101889]